MAFGYLGMICNGVQIVEAKKADLDIALIEIHPESKNYVFSLSVFNPRRLWFQICWEPFSIL